MLPPRASPLRRLVRSLPLKDIAPRLRPHVGEVDHAMSLSAEGIVQWQIVGQDGNLPSGSARDSCVGDPKAHEEWVADYVNATLRSLYPLRHERSKPCADRSEQWFLDLAEKIACLSQDMRCDENALMRGHHIIQQSCIRGRVSFGTPHSLNLSRVDRGNDRDYEEIRVDQQQ